MLNDSLLSALLFSLNGDTAYPTVALLRIVNVVLKRRKKKKREQKKKENYRYKGIEK